MLSAVIHTQLSYPAMLLAEQLEHHWLVQSGPLANPIKRGIRSPQPNHTRSYNQAACAHER